MSAAVGVRGDHGPAARRAGPRHPGSGGLAGDPAAVPLGNRDGGSDGDWAWNVWYVSDHGYGEITVTVGHLDGQANGSAGGSVRLP